MSTTLNNQILQNKAVRVVLKLPPRSNRQAMFKEAGLMTVKQLIFYHTMKNIFKIRLAKEPEYLYDIFKNENIRGNIVIKNTKLKLARNGFVYRGSEHWNSLPHDIQNIKHSVFKNRVKVWILENIPQFS